MRRALQHNHVGVGGDLDADKLILALVILRDVSEEAGILLRGKDRYIDTQGLTDLSREDQTVVASTTAMHIGGKYIDLHRASPAHCDTKPLP